MLRFSHAEEQNLNYWCAHFRQMGATEKLHNIPRCIGEPHQISLGKQRCFTMFATVGTTENTMETMLKPACVNILFIETITCSIICPENTTMCSPFFQ